MTEDASIILHNTVNKPEIFRKYFGRYDSLFNQAMGLIGVNTIIELIENGFILYFSKEYDFRTSTNLLRIPKFSISTLSDNQNLPIIWTCEFIRYPSEEVLVRLIEYTRKRYEGTSVRFHQ